MGHVPHAGRPGHPYLITFPVRRELSGVTGRTDFAPSLRGKIPTPPTQVGYEPSPQMDDLTPENLGSSLLDFVKACARETGTEKILAVRRNIHQVLYGKDSISVDFIVSRGLGTPESDFARPPDGKSLVNQNLTAVPHSGTKSFCPPARNSESSLCPPAKNRKNPTAFGDWTLTPGSSREKMEPRMGIEPTTTSLRNWCSTS